MKLAKTSIEEIKSLRDILNEVEWLQKELIGGYCYSINEVDFEDYPIMQKFRTDTDINFIEDLCNHLSNIHFQRILMNCEVMLDNCADTDSDVLDFNDKIKKGLELYEIWEQEQTKEN